MVATSAAHAAQYPAAATSGASDQNRLAKASPRKAALQRRVGSAKQDVGIEGAPPMEENAAKTNNAILSATETPVPCCGSY